MQFQSHGHSQRYSRMAWMRVQCMETCNARRVRLLSCAVGCSTVVASLISTGVFNRMGIGNGEAEWQHACMQELAYTA